MAVRVTFTPNPVGGDDPLNIAQVLESLGGVFGSGNDNPVIGVEDDGTPYILTARDGGFDGEKLTDPSAFDGQMFRRLHGHVEVVHSFES